MMVMDERHGSLAGLAHAVRNGHAGIVSKVGRHSWGWEELLAVMAIAASMYLLIGSALSAEFYLVEDHHLLGIEPWTISSWLQRIQSDIVNFQRFRPMYWAYVAFGATWFGRDPHVWHFFAFVWGVLSLLLFYRCARILGASIVASLLFVAITGFSSSQAWIWMNLVPQETPGVMLLSVACWAFAVAPGHPSRSFWDWSGFIALTCATLCKESFVLVVPAVVLMRLMRERQVTDASWVRCVAATKGVLLAGSLLFVLGMAVVLTVMLSKPEGYSANASGFSLASFNPFRWHQLLSKLSLGIPLSVAFAVLIVRAIRQPERRGLLIGSLLVALAWVVPQLVLYARGIDERYLFPAIIGIAGVVALGYSLMPRQLRYIPQLFMLGLTLPAIMDGGRWANKTANWLTAETISSHRMIMFLAQNVPAGRSVLIAGDPGTGYGYEALYSLPIYLKLVGAQADISTWPLASLQAPGYSRSDAPTSLEHPLPGPKAVDAIVLVDTFTPGLKMEPVERWLGNSQWKELTFAEPYRRRSESSLFQVETDMVAHKVLVPAPASGLRSNQLITIADEVSDVGVSPLIDGPPWGLENDYMGPGKIVWIGQGDAQGLGGVFISAAAREITIAVEAVPGPSRAGNDRTVELVLGKGDEEHVVQKQFNGGTWVFKVELRQGQNPFRLRVLDAPTVAALPNGDTRTLMALVRKIRVSE